MTGITPLLALVAGGALLAWDGRRRLLRDPAGPEPAPLVRLSRRRNPQGDAPQGDAPQGDAPQGDSLSGGRTAEAALELLLLGGLVGLALLLLLPWAAGSGAGACSPQQPGAACAEGAVLSPAPWLLVLVALLPLLVLLGSALRRLR